jgi:FkbM family methyltransferase
VLLHRLEVGLYRNFKWTRASGFRNDLTKAYEPIQPLLLSAFAKRASCNTFIDVGANIGVYSVLMSQVESIREIHAFEPTPGTFRELVKNVEMNGLGGRITAHQKALSDSAKSVRFGIVNPLSGANSIVSTSIHSRFEDEVHVAAVKLDDYLPLKDKRLCLKIDVEGHEREALSGMSSILSDNPVVLQIEDYASNADDLPRVLGQLGLHSLCRVGPDRYFSNLSDLGDGDVVSAFETASSALIREALADLQDREGNGIRPIQINVGRSFSFVLKGRAAASARRIRHPWRKI